MRVLLCLYSLLTFIWSQLLYQPDEILEFTAGFSLSGGHTEPNLVFDSVPEAGGKNKYFSLYPEMILLTKSPNTSCCLIVVRLGEKW